jgi:acid phosphatase (class A)
MISRAFLFAPFCGLALLAACSPSAPEPPAPAAEDTRSPVPYLPVDTLDPLALLPPPPAAGTPAAAADARAYTAAGANAGTPAWTRATSLNGVRTPAFRKELSCALGVALSEADTPANLKLLSLTNAQLRPLTDMAQAHFKRPRPFGDDPSIACDPNAATLGPSYPSGQAATGWLWALTLADARPERRAALLAFGRDAGDVRVTCRVHWQSDVDAGRTLAEALHRQLSANPAYKADLDAARREIALAPVPDCGASGS